MDIKAVMANTANALEKDFPMGISINYSKPNHSQINKTENKSVKIEKYQPILNPLSEKIPTQNIFHPSTPNHNNHNTSTSLNHHPSATTPSITKTYCISYITLTTSPCQIYHHASNINNNIINNPINHQPITNPITTINRTLTEKPYPKSLSLKGFPHKP